MAQDGVDRIVEQWARERPDLDTEPMAVFGRIYRIAAASGERMEAAYGRFGIGRGDFDVLATLRRSGPPFQLTPGALSGALMVTTGGMTGRLNRLEAAGLVTRSPAETDRRSLVVGLTDRGREVIDEAVGAGLEVQARLLEDLSPADRRRLGDLLRKLGIAVAASSS